MTLRDDLIPLVREIRGIPGQLGIRPHRVFLVTTSSDGTYVGDGTITETETEIFEGNSQPPKVMQPNDEQLAMGNVSAGDLIVGPITPYYSGAGIALSEVSGDGLTAQTDTLRFRVSGPIGNQYYRLKSKKLDKALHWTLTLEPISEVPA